MFLHTDGDKGISVFIDKYSINDKIAAGYRKVFSMMFSVSYVLYNLGIRAAVLFAFVFWGVAIIAPQLYANPDFMRLPHYAGAGIFIIVLLGAALRLFTVRPDGYEGIFDAE